MNDNNSLMSHQTSWDCWTYFYSMFDSYEWVKYSRESFRLMPLRGPRVWAKIYLSNAVNVWLLCMVGYEFLFWKFLYETTRVLV